LPTKSIQGLGLQLPNLPLGLRGLDMKQTVLATAGAWAQAPSGSGAAVLDLSNAYARIYAANSNIFTTTKDGSIYRLDQPIQGLATAGTLAPAQMACWFTQQTRTCRRQFSRADKKPFYLHSFSYSDNLMLIAEDVNRVLEWFKQRHGSLINPSQTKEIGSQPVRTLGFRWSVKDSTLIIRRPPKDKTAARRSFYDYMIGRQPLMAIIRGGGLQLHVDGVSRNHQATSAAGIFQKGRIITATVRVKQGIDQLLSEAHAIKIGQHLRDQLKQPTLPIRTDSNILLTINKSTNPRDTIEHRIIAGVEELEFIPGEDNQADQLTREETLIHKFNQKRPRRIHSTNTSPTRATSPNHKRPKVHSRHKRPRPESPSESEEEISIRSISSEEESRTNDTFS